MALDLRTLVWLVWGRNIEKKPRRATRRGVPRDSRYCAWIRTHRCAACGSNWLVEAAHTGSDGGMSMKASDYSCVPLCKECHTGGSNSYHRIGKLRFEEASGMDFTELVGKLNAAWKVERGGKVVASERPSPPRSETGSSGAAEKEVA